MLQHGVRVLQPVCRSRPWASRGASCLLAMGRCDRQGPVQGCFPGGPVAQLCAELEAQTATQPPRDMRRRLYVLINPGGGTKLCASDATGTLLARYHAASCSTLGLHAWHEAWHNAGSEIGCLQGAAIGMWTILLQLVQPPLSLYLSAV